MLKAKDKFTIALAVLGTALLVITLACSIVFAAFTANKQATTTIQFHEGVEIVVSGIDNSGKWIYNTNGGDAFVGTSPTTSALDGLALSPITVSVKKGASQATPVFVRIFAVVTSNASATMPTLSLNTTPAEYQGEGTTLEDEDSFISSNQPNKTESIVGIFKFTSTSSTPGTTILNKYTLFTAGDSTNAFHGSTFKAYVRIYASTTNGQWGDGYTFSFN